MCSPTFRNFTQFYQFAYPSDKCILSNYPNFISKGKYSTLFLFKIVMVLLDPFLFYVNFRISLPSSPESRAGIWIGILNW